MRLGFAVQLGTVRFLGTFLEQPADLPAQAIAFVAGQLGMQAAGLLDGAAWESARPAVCRSLGVSASGPEEVARMAERLGAA